MQLLQRRGWLALCAIVGLIPGCGGGGAGDRAPAPSQPPVPAAVASVSVQVTSASLVVGATTEATAELRSASGTALTGRPVAWTSATPTVATVDANGLVRAVAPGTATITATSEGRSGSATVTVTPVPVATITVRLAAASLVAGTTTQGAAELRDAAGTVLTGRPVTWTSATPTVATVDANGLVRAVAPGTATITATSEGRSGSATVTVTSTSSGALTRGDWLITGRDTGGNVWTGSLLTFTAVADSAGVRNVQGYFDWTGNNRQFFGRELFRGAIAANGRMRLLGVGLVGETRGIVSGALYEADLTADGSRIVNGTWGGGGVLPSQAWSAVHRPDGGP